MTRDFIFLISIYKITSQNLKSWGGGSEKFITKNILQNSIKKSVNYVCLFSNC